MGNCRGCCPEVGADTGHRGEFPCSQPPTPGRRTHPAQARAQAGGCQDGGTRRRSPALPDTENPPGGALISYTRFLGGDTRVEMLSIDDPEKPQAPPLRDMKRPRRGGQSRGCRGLYRGRVTTGRDPGQEVHRDVERRCWPPLF